MFCDGPALDWVPDDDIQMALKNNAIERIWVSSHLYRKTEDHNCYYELERASEVLYHALCSDSRDLYDCRPDAFLEFYFLIYILTGNECTDELLNCTDIVHPFRYDGQAHVAAYISHAASIALFFYTNENDTAANDILNRLISFDYDTFFSIKDKNIEGMLYTNLIWEYYFSVDSAKTYELLCSHGNAIQEYNVALYAVICNELSVKMEVLDKELALNCAIWAYEVLDDARWGLTDAQEYCILFNYYCFIHVYRHDVSVIPRFEQIAREIDELVKELSDSHEIEVLEILEARCISWILNDIAQKEDAAVFRVRYPLAQKFYDITLKYFDETKDMMLYNHKEAAHQLSIAYMQDGQYVPAERYMKEALSLSEICPNKQTDFYVLTNLSFMYLMHNHNKEARSVSRKIYSMVAKNDGIENVSQNMIIKGVVAFCTTYLKDGHQKYAKKLLQQMLDSGRIYNDGYNRLIMIVYSTLFFISLAPNKSLTADEMNRFQGYFDEIEHSHFYKELSEYDHLNFMSYKAVFYWKLGDNSIYHKIKKSALDILNHLPIYAVEGYIGTLGNFTALAMWSNDTDYAVRFADSILALCSKVLNRALAYQRRQRLVSYSQFYNAEALLVYSVYRNLASAEHAYSVVLNWKDVVSLITQYREVVFSKMSIEHDKIHQINHLMDLQAGMQLDSICNIGIYDESAFAGIAQELEKLEFELSLQLKEKAKYRNFQVSDLAQQIPDDSVFLDYFVHIDQFYALAFDGITRDYELDSILIDLYVLRKTGGQCTMSRIPIALEEKTFTALSMLLDEISKPNHRKISGYQQYLYEKLISPAEDKLEHIEHLYISTDGFLNNVPFEVFLDKNKRLLGAVYEVTMVNSGRDFIRRSKKLYEGAFVIVGDPAYDCAGSQESDGHRSMQLRNRICRLPFSELESHMIAKEYQVSPFTGVHANRQIIERMKHAKWIHLATHGVNDISDDPDAVWYSCAIFLAGAERWRETGEVDPVYGNGVLTADEISRMDLSGTELVVLSACFTGSDSQTIDMASVRAAFRYAGVKYVVSTLWGIDDVPSALFMARFYHNLKSMSIPVAFQEAKLYLRNLTREEVLYILKEGISSFPLTNESIIRDYILEAEVRNVLTDEKPFDNPFYWAAFICSQNAF